MWEFIKEMREHFAATLAYNFTRDKRADELTEASLAEQKRANAAMEDLQRQANQAAEEAQRRVEAVQAEVDAGAAEDTEIDRAIQMRIAAALERIAGRLERTDL